MFQSNFLFHFNVLKWVRLPKDLHKISSWHKWEITVVMTENWLNLQQWHRICVWQTGVGLRNGTLQWFPGCTCLQFCLVVPMLKSKPCWEIDNGKQEGGRERTGCEFTPKLSYAVNYIKWVSNFLLRRCSVLGEEKRFDCYFTAVHFHQLSSLWRFL